MVSVKHFSAIRSISSLYPPLSYPSEGLFGRLDEEDWVSFDSDHSVGGDASPFFLLM